MATETYAIVCDFSEFGEAEDLESARVGQYGAVPRHHFMQTAKLPYAFMTRTVHEVVRVSKAEQKRLLEVPLSKPLNKNKESEDGPLKVGKEF